MKIRSLCLFLCLTLSVLQARAYEERNIFMNSATPQEVKESLVMDQKWVKYPAYSDRAGWDALFGQFKDSYINHGNDLMDYQWHVVKATDYLEFERTGDRAAMENPYYSDTHAMASFFLAEMAEGKGRFIDPLIDGVFHICEMTSWTASAHNVQQRTGRSLPSYDQPVLDLREAEMGHLLSWIYYFMKDEFDKVDPEIARRLRHELQVKVLDPYMNDSSFEWMARGAKGTAQNNWNVRCNCNTLMAFMLLENDRETLAKAVLESMRSVDQYVNYITHDGACDEGPSYWNTAGAQLYDYVEILKAITGGKVNLLSHPYLKRAGEYICHSFIGLDWVVNFADAPARGSSSPFVVYRFGKGVNSEIMKHFAAALYRKDDTPTSFGIGSDIYRIFEAMTIQKELAATSPEQIREPFVWYPETEFCYLSDPDGLFVAAKGGNNNESHNHNDVGTFILYMDNQPVMIDAGVGTYRRQTFDSSRYTIWTMQSNYHNLPMINGVAQKDGADYKASEAVAKPGFFSVNIAGAFPEEAKVDRWTRSYQLNGKTLRVNDAFALKQTVAPNVVNFLTWGDVKKVADGKVTISVNGVDALLTYDPRSFDYSIETITLDDPRLSDVWGKEVYRVSLKATKMTKKGNYSFTIKKL